MCLSDLVFFQVVCSFDISKLILRVEYVSFNKDMLHGALRASSNKKIESIPPKLVK